MTISERIAINARYLCKQQGKSITDMEAAVGISPGYLSRVKGKAVMRIDVGYALAGWLDVSMDELIDPMLTRRLRIAELKKELAELEAEEGE